MTRVYKATNMSTFNYLLSTHCPTPARASPPAHLSMLLRYECPSCPPTAYSRSSSTATPTPQRRLDMGAIMRHSQVWGSNCSTEAIASPLHQPPTAGGGGSRRSELVSREARRTSVMVSCVSYINDEAAPVVLYSRTKSDPRIAKNYNNRG